MNTKKAFLGGLLFFTLVAFKDAPTHFARHRWFHRQATGDIYIVITKSKYELQLFDQQGWYATYPAVFGNKTLEDKMVRGDRKTPEGAYRIISKRPHEKWDKIMEMTVDNYQNWTNGCISLKCEDMDEVYSLAPIGTKVTILH